MQENDKSYSLDDIQGDIVHLGHLIDETMTKLLDVDHHTLTPETKHYIDRVSAFVWIARDLAERIGGGFSQARRADLASLKKALSALDQGGKEGSC